MGWIAAVSALVALYGLHRLALWLEARGWLYYIHKKPARGVVLRRVHAGAAPAP